MSKGQKWYCGILIAVGVALGLWCTVAYLRSGSLLTASADGIGAGHFFFLLLLFIFSRAMPIYLSEDRCLDISFIGILSALIILGPQATVAVILLGTPFVVECGPKKGDPARHIFNSDPVKTLFNLSNLILSVYIPGQLYLLLGGMPGTLRLLHDLPALLVFSLSSLVLNAVFLIRLFTLGKPGAFWGSLLDTLKLVLPNMAAMAPMGVLLAFLLLLPNGTAMALVFLVPLLLARYAFKLYINSRQEHYQMVQTLVATIEAKDKYTEGHSKRVSSYAISIAEAMRLGRQQVDDIRVASLLHDIGKIGVSDAILNKPGPLTDEEWGQIQKHPAIGVGILKHIDLSPRIISIILHHHERYDGKGYPDGTDGTSTPLEAFILGVADSYDAMTSDRSYRKGLPLERAVSILREERGKQFHPQVVDAFLGILADQGNGTPGSDAPEPEFSAV